MAALGPWHGPCSPQKDKVGRVGLQGSLPPAPSAGLPQSLPDHPSRKPLNLCTLGPLSDSSPHTLTHLLYPQTSVCSSGKWRCLTEFPPQGCWENLGDRASKGRGDPQRVWGPGDPEDPEEATHRPRRRDSGQQRTRASSALSLCIPGPFFSRKQATFITSDSQALMQSRWSHELQMHCSEEAEPLGPREVAHPGPPGRWSAEGHSEDPGS